MLFGTGDAAHLRANVASLLKPPLPEADRAKLVALFGHLTDGIGLDALQIFVDPRDFLKSSALDGR